MMLRVYFVVLYILCATGLQLGPRSKLFYATTLTGMEPLLADEVRMLPGVSNVKVGKAGVEFHGTIETGLEGLMWLRTPLKLMEQLSTINGIDSKISLSNWIRTLKWDEVISSKQTLKCDVVVGRDISPELGHSHFTALTIKNAIVDQFRDKYGIRPSVDVVDPDLPLLLYLHKEKGTLYRVWSGEQSLHKRGYRSDAIHKAALRETTAAALLMSTPWKDLALSSEAVLCDPMCGSGTFAIEAAFMAADTAPGLLRYADPTGQGSVGARSGDGYINQQPSTLRWVDTPTEATVTWKDVYRAAQQRDRRLALHTAPPRSPRILANDIHSGAVKLARQAAQRAGVDHLISFSEGDIAAFWPAQRWDVVVTNPPWDKRLEGAQEAWVKLAAFLAAEKQRWPEVDKSGELVSGSSEAERGHDGRRMENSTSASSTVAQHSNRSSGDKDSSGEPRKSHHKRGRSVWVLNGNPDMVLVHGLDRPRNVQKVRIATVDVNLYGYDV